MIWKAFAVEVIRQLWDQGLYRQNKVLQQIHSNWFNDWVEWRTQQTMKDVDRQAKEFPGESGIPDPVYSETTEGETALGGEMRLTAPWHEDHNERSL